MEDRSGYFGLGIDPNDEHQTQPKQVRVTIRPKKEVDTPQVESQEKVVSYTVDKSQIDKDEEPKQQTKKINRVHMDTPHEKVDKNTTQKKTRGRPRKHTADNNE